MKRDELRVIPKKNYVILGVVIIVTLLLLFYFYKWIDVYNESKLNRPILDKYMDIINYNELDNYLVENQDTIIYLSVLNNEKIREFEKQFKNVLRKKDIQKEILYMDITDDIKDKEIIDDIKNKYMIDAMDLPVVMVFENGVIKNVYKIKDNNYDIREFVIYVNEIRYSEDSDIND